MILFIYIYKLYLCTIKAKLLELCSQSCCFWNWGITLHHSDSLSASRAGAIGHCIEVPERDWVGQELKGEVMVNHEILDWDSGSWWHSGLWFFWVLCDRRVLDTPVWLAKWGSLGIHGQSVWCKKQDSTGWGWSGPNIWIWDRDLAWFSHQCGAILHSCLMFFSSLPHLDAFGRFPTGTFW